MSKPLPRVSPAKYASAKVKVRPVGSTVEGHLYQGQHLLTPCSNCPPLNLPYAKDSPAVPVWNADTGVRL